jgi:anti-anti-sigma regulatory factor
MDINQQLQPIIAGMVSELRGTIDVELRQQVTAEVVKTLAGTELTSIINNLVTQQVQARLDKFDFAGTGEQELKIAFKQITDQVSKNLAASTNNQISAWVSQKLTAINIRESVESVVQTAISDNLKGTTFPEGSIPHSSINFTGIKLTGDNIQGGIISKFGSTGIDDLSTRIQMTIMDNAVAFESGLHTPEANVTGNLTVKGQISIQGEFDSTTQGFKKLVSDTSQAVREELNTELFDSFTGTIFNKIQTD